MAALPVSNSCYTTLSADESAVLLAAKIRAQEPFFFVRYGDGALECISGRHGMTRDCEAYSAALGRGLLDAWRALMARPENVYVGDWESASFDARSEYARYECAYADLIGDARPHFLHFEALLVMRMSAALRSFYVAVKEDPRRKLFMGPAGNAAAAKMLGAEFLEVPLRDLFRHTPRFTEELLARDFDVLLYGAGMAGNIPAIRSWAQHPERTYINLGSAMDPLFRGRSRFQQLEPLQARIFFREAGLL